ncbi:MAG: lysophospholipid acyltransferase family protein [Hyphomicrobiaceae bacterium]
MIRSIAFDISFYIATALFLILGSPLLLAPRSWAMAGFRAHARTTLWLMRAIVGTEMEVRGREHLPVGPYLIAAKHQSAWDTIALPLLFPDPTLVMKAELLKIPVYGWFCAKFGMIPIQRETGPSALRQMLKAARARAADDRQILVFPEGTRRPPGAPPSYKPGILLLYDALELPCVPVALNSGHFWPRNSFRRRPGRIVVEILPPLPAGLPRKELRSRLVTAIEDRTAELDSEAERALEQIDTRLAPGE